MSIDVASIMGGLYGDGIIVRKEAFDPRWADELREDVMRIFEREKNRAGGVVARGPNRFYVEIHPERVRHFVDLASNPFVAEVSHAVLGPGWKIVELGFDVPFPGAQDQPWHRDFASGEATLVGRRLDSLAFNMTLVDITPEMGPFEIAVGTQWDEPEGFEAGMFPPESLYPRYAARAQKKLARRGDISARTALCIHRGTANRSTIARPMLVLGVDAPGAPNAIRHDLQVTRAFHKTLPPHVRDHLACRVVEELEPIHQAHQIPGLLRGMG